MENLTTILTCSIIFNLLIVSAVMFFISKVRNDQRKRQEKLVEQAKIITTQKESVDIAQKVIETYKGMSSLL